MAILRKGLRGEPVRRLQSKLGVAIDGIFGPATEKAVREFQKENSLAVDGIAGPDTFSEMGLHELVLLKRGSRGKLVKRLQEALDTGADGIFGKGTEAKVRAFQELNHLDVDGIAGPKTLAAMELFTEFDDNVAGLSEIPESGGGWLFTDGAVLPEGESPEEMGPPADLAEDSAGDDVVAENAAEDEEEEEEKGVMRSIWDTVTDAIS